ncbi:MAG TPA: sigma-70 family RNA polymerase sigma factor [Bacteroidia bacterium]|jgi:RNA polymerase sigma factor (sigma-70 family)|nr:sigma-70 family RNA polymerase sigma factor [Bacteroidia bacterium]
MSSLKEFEKIPDADIIKKITAGSVPLFELLIRRTNPFLYKVGRSYGYNHEDVQDIMQDTFINAFTNLSQFQNRASFKTWIIQIMLNNCYRKKQKSSTKNEIASEKGITEKSTPMFTNKNNGNTEKVVMNKELNKVIEDALEEIPLEYRMVFSLREITGLTVAETAKTLDITETNVKARLSRSKAMLRKKIEKMYSAEDIYEFNLIYCDMMVKRVMNEIDNKKHE